MLARLAYAAALAALTALAVAPTSSSPPRRHPAGANGPGGVVLELDRDATAYFDGAPGEVKGYGTGASVAMPEGRHLVTVVRPGHPPAMGQITVYPGYRTTFRLKIRSRDAEEPR